MGFRYALPSQPWGPRDAEFGSSWLWRAQTADLSSGTELVSNGLYAGGAAKWRSTHNISWESGAWNANLGIYHVGKTIDSPSLTAAQYANLGQPDLSPPIRRPSVAR